MAEFLVPVLPSDIPVTANPSPAAPGPLIHTAWMPQPCSSSDMAGTDMQYGLVPAVLE